MTSSLGIPYVHGSPFLDIESVFETVRGVVPDLLTVVETKDKVTGETHTVLDKVFDVRVNSDVRVNFDLTFASKLTYHAGDATVGWLDDLEPLFVLYRNIGRLSMTSQSLRK